MNPTHLGDGAYLSPGRYEGELVMTANHHNPEQASDVIWLDEYAISRLIQLLNDYVAELQAKQQ